MGVNFNDQTGNARHAKPTNMPTTLVTREGPFADRDVVVFDGVDDHAHTPIDYTGVTKLTVVVRFYADSALLNATHNVLLANANVGATDGFAANVNASNSKLYWYHGGSSHNIDITKDAWQTFVGSIDTVAAEKKLSINGGSFVTLTPASSNVLETGFDTFVGTRRSITTQEFGGAIAYVAIIKGKVLSELEKDALYAAATPAAYKALLDTHGATAYWSLEDEDEGDADYFVNPVSGDDANDGSYRSPWASIDHASGEVSGGDVVELADGTYTEDSGSGYLDLGGLAYTSAVVFRAENAGLPVIESASSVFTVYAGAATQNWTFEQVKFRHRDTGMRWIVYFAGGCDDITLDRCTWLVDDTVHASGGDCVYVSANTATGLRILSPTCDISNGQDFGFLHVATGGAVADGLTLTGMALTGDSVRARFIQLGDLRGTCTIDGPVAAAGAAADTSHLIHIEDAGAACTLDFGDGLTMAAANCRGISIMEAGSAANMTLAGGDVTVTSPRRGFGAEFGVTGAVGTITVTKSGAVVNNAVELRSDSTDSGTLAVKDFTADAIVITQEAAGHGLLMGRHSENITVKALTVNDGAQDIAVVDKGDGNSIGTVTPAVIHGGTVGALYLKGGRGGTYDNAKIYQDNGGEAISFVYDDVALNKTGDCSVQGCCVVVTDGTLFEHAGTAVDDGGNVVDGNTYVVSAGESWGRVRGTSVAGLMDVLAAWDSYDEAANDETSIAPGVLVYDTATGGNLIALVALPVSPATAWAADLDGLLSAGTYTLGVLAVNAYGCASARETIGVVIGSGGEVDQGMITPTNVVAEVLSGGSVAVSWDAVDDVASGTNQLEPAEFEIAEAGDLATVLATVGFRATRVHRDELGPFTDGATVTLNVRSSDGVVSGQRGDWVAASAVVADATGPVAPDIDEDALPAGCGCS